MSPEFNDNMTLSNNVWQKISYIFFLLSLVLWVYMPLIVTLEEPVNSKYNSIMKICVKKTIIPQKGVRGIPFLILFTLKIEISVKEKECNCKNIYWVKAFLWWSWFDNNSKWKANSEYATVIHNNKWMANNAKIV